MLLAGIVFGACNSRPPVAIEEAASVANVDVSSLVNPDEWEIWAECGYSHNDVMSVHVSHPDMRETNLYFCDADGYSRPCEYNVPGSGYCDCVWVPMDTTTFTVYSAESVTPALRGSFSPADFRPTLCEDDPDGWSLPYYCTRGRSDIFNVEFLFPDIYSPTGCDLIDDQGVHYACEIVSMLDDQACLCRGIPNTTSYVTRQLVLADGSTVESRISIYRQYCQNEPTPTPGGSTAGPIDWNIDDCRRSDSLGVMLFVVRFPGDYAGRVDTVSIDSSDCEVVHTELADFLIGVTCPLGSTPDPFLVKLSLTDGTAADHTFDVGLWWAGCGLAEDTGGGAEGGAQPGGGLPTGCGLQTTYDDCKAFGGCYWWPHYSECGTQPEPPIDCYNTYSKDQATCQADPRCTWDGAYCQDAP